MKNMKNQHQNKHDCTFLQKRFFINLDLPSEKTVQ